MYRVVSARPVSEDNAVKTVDVVVAQHPLPLGTRLTKDHVKLVKWPAETQVPGAFAKVEEVVDRGLIATVEENEPLTAAKLAPLEAAPACRRRFRRACAPSRSRSTKWSAWPASSCPARASTSWSR